MYAQQEVGFCDGDFIKYSIQLSTLFNPPFKATHFNYKSVSTQQFGGFEKLLEIHGVVATLALMAPKSKSSP